MLKCRNVLKGQTGIYHLISHKLFDIVQNEENSHAGSEIYLGRCLELAQRAKGHTAPNPMVGALLVYNERVIGEGWHHLHGAAHAEVACLENVAAADKHLIPESTMYVNLEPCAHHGHTPPCAVRLVKERVKKVVIANVDPFDKVSGKGIEILKQGGVEVEAGLMDREGLWLNRRFFCFHTHRRPYVILKWAQTLNGYIAPADRSRFQITAGASRQLVHRWRTEEAAIIVGTATARNDNPELTARLWSGKQPLRIVLDRNLTLPRHHHLFNNTAPTWIVNELEESASGNVAYVKLPFGDTLLPNLMERLFKAKILSLIVEGGAALLESFMHLGLWDEARIFIGAVDLANGLPAPVLKNGTLAFTQKMEQDNLGVFVNKDSMYPYAGGMDL